MSAPEPLLLAETGIARLDDGSEAVNVGPIVAALRFLTEGRGDDRGIDETGAPLPDLLSLAFEVVKSIILGGRYAEYFRGVKRELDARAEGDTSLGLAKQAVRHTLPTAALKKAGFELQGRARKLEQALATLMTELDALTAPSPAPVKRARPRPARTPAPPPPERVTKTSRRKPRPAPSKSPKSLKAPKSPKSPKSLKAPKSPKSLKAPKSPKSPKSLKAPKSPKAPKARKAAKSPKSPTTSRPSKKPSKEPRQKAR